MTPGRYVPDEGDIAWLNLNPRTGREQAGHRPVLVISPGAFNRGSGLLVCCPLTTQHKGYPFEVVLQGEFTSVALVDQVRSVDWEARGATFKGRASAADMAEVRGKLVALIGAQT
ncbi:MAG: endoribonuclease MazF [Thermomicrobiales bacterium]